MPAPKPMPPLPAANGGEPRPVVAGEAVTALLLRLPPAADKADRQQAAADAAVVADRLMMEYRQRFR